MIVTVNSLAINIRYKNEDTRRLEILPNGDWIDLSIDEDVSMSSGEYKLIPLGVAMQLPFGYEAHIIPRSSTFEKYGILQTNSFGLIDNSYKGDNDWWKFPALAMRDTRFDRGTRICQFRVEKKQPHLDFIEYTIFNKASRGGFGSTGN